MRILTLLRFSWGQGVVLGLTVVPLQQTPEVSAFDGSANTTPQKLQEMVTQNDDTVRNIKIDQKLTPKMFSPAKRTS